MPTRRLLSLFPLAAVGLTLGCNDFVQNPGAYELRTLEVMRDECDLLPTDEMTWTSSMLITGQVVRMDFKPGMGLSEEENVRLVGRFLASGERFAVDGSGANATAVINGQECLLDQVSVHLEGTTQCATQFTGALRVRYEARRPDSCVCELWARIEGVQDSATCPVDP